MTGGFDGPIDLATARELITMGEHPRSEPQLEGAVAVHNILERERVAYLADEVGLGKTYVALAVIGLFRHFQPGFRVLIIAPKRNLQRKWANDLRSFVRTNWKINDLRVKGAGGDPSRPVVQPERLADLAHETMVDDDRDFIARLTSFSFALNADRDRVIANVRRQLPWLPVSRFPADKESTTWRDFIAQGYNAAMPRFDLVIIDEAHNLGGGIPVANGRIGPGPLRNAVLAQTLGTPAVKPLAVFEQTYRPIADRVLLLSATPVEASFAALWRQLHLVGKDQPVGRPNFEDLKSSNDGVAARTAERILIRRINAIPVNDKLLTKNLYRRTWHNGGVRLYDEELDRGTPRQQLTVALVQKKVADLIGARFNNNFQMGMLASFESFGQTARLNREPENDDAEPTPESSFDDGEQADSAEERLGVDVDVINHLASSHARKFKQEMAHPKMDALVEDLSGSWEHGSKTLVFVRRIASVPELKRKLDERYDAWLFARLERDLPAAVWDQIARIRSTYLRDHLAHGRNQVDGQQGAKEDQGGSDTFFSWFFRGQGPKSRSNEEALMIESGASISDAVNRDSGGASTIFAHHHVSDVLGCAPREALHTVCLTVGLPPDEVSTEIVERARKYLRPSAGRRRRFDAVQLATLELLRERGRHPAAERILHALSPTPESQPSTSELNPAEELAVETFFTRVRGHETLAPYFTVAAGPDGRDPRDQLFADALVRAAARRGHALIDLYISFMTASGAKTLPSDRTDVADAALTEFLQRLDAQRERQDRSGAFWELSRLVENLDLIRSKNLPETLLASFKLSEAPTVLGNALGAQQPTVGMFGRVNATAVRQFRMPGYPYVLVCTDVLQEGEDLHLFCDRVVHYGVAWTPSSMEQRSGRIDRLYSLAERRFTAVDNEHRDLEGSELIQVQIPYLPDTVEVLQTRRVIERMHRFTSLMHRNVGSAEKRVDISTEIVKGSWTPPKVDATLVSAFDVLERDKSGLRRSPAVPPTAVSDWWSRILALTTDPETRDLFREKDVDHDQRRMYAWRHIGRRVQPFSLRLTSRGFLPLVQAMTPVGRIGLDGLAQAQAEAHEVISRVTVSFAAEREYDMAIEGDVILGEARFDAARVRALVERITRDADRIEEQLTGHDLKLSDVRRTMDRDVHG